MSCDLGEVKLCSFCNLSVTSPVTTHSPTLLLLHLHYSSFSNPSFASPTSQALHLIHMASRPWVYLLTIVTDVGWLMNDWNYWQYRTLLSWSTGFNSLYLHHSSFSNPSVASLTSQLILQPFFRFSYVTGSSPGEPSMIISNLKSRRLRWAGHVAHMKLSRNA